MGLCSSCEATAVMPLSTAKLVLEDGKLQEFSCPVKASHALWKDRRTHFVCSADDMEFDGFVSALRADEELQLGQLYFVLPRSMLSHPLHPEDMAALAVKASAALKGAAEKCGCRRGPGAPLVFAAGSRGDVAEERRRTLVERTKSRRGSGAKRNFSSELRAIPE